MGKFINEFKEFAVKGNAVDMAVGVIIGGAFGKIVTSIVNDIIMPPIGWLIGGVKLPTSSVSFPPSTSVWRSWNLSPSITATSFRRCSTLSSLPSVCSCWSRASTRWPARRLRSLPLLLLLPLPLPRRNCSRRFAIC